MIGRLRLGGTVYLAALYLFLFFPALLVVIFSFNDSRFWAFPLRGFTLRWYAALFGRVEALDALWNSVTVAVPAVACSVALGTGLVLAFHRRRFPLRGVLEGIVLLPLLIPSLIWALALLLLLTYFAVPTGAATVTLGHVLYTTPFVVLLVTTRMRSLDPNLEDAARSLGAGTGMVFHRIVVPHLMPALVAGALIAFAVSFSDLIVAFFLGGGGFNTLPVFIYSLIQFEPTPMINAVSALILAIGSLCVLAAMRIGGRDALTFGKGGPREL